MSASIRSDACSKTTDHDRQAGRIRRVEWEFLAMLKQEGRKSAGDFLTSCGANLGTKSSADLDVLLMEC
jgi:hypothetical protein